MISSRFVLFLFCLILCCYSCFDLFSLLIYCIVCSRKSTGIRMCVFSGVLSNLADNCTAVCNVQ